MNEAQRSISETAEGQALAAAFNASDEAYMRRCLALAEQAAERGDVPVGAVLVHDQRIIAEAYNRRESDHDPTGHAELLVLREAAQKLGIWRFEDCRLYVSLEPCAMCMGAILQCQVSELVFATPEPKTGACGSLLNLAESPLNHHLRVRHGLLADEAAEQLKAFFRARRKVRLTAAYRRQKRDERQAILQKDSAKEL